MNQDTFISLIDISQDARHYMMQYPTFEETAIAFEIKNCVGKSSLDCEWMQQQLGIPSGHMCRQLCFYLDSLQQPGADYLDLEYVVSILKRTVYSEVHFCYIMKCIMLAHCMPQRWSWGRRLYNINSIS